MLESHCALHILCLGDLVQYFDVISIVRTYCMLNAIIKNERKVPLTFEAISSPSLEWGSWLRNQGGLAIAHADLLLNPYTYVYACECVVLFLYARKRLVAAFQSILDKRRNLRKNGDINAKKKDMMDSLLGVEDENGRKLTDEEIIDVILMYLNAGHESSGHITTWAAIFLQEHPEFLQKAKEEQEQIVKRRPPTQKGLSLKEVREMNYLSKVIDETLRLITFSLAVFREAKTDFSINGYIIPKGWKVLVWFRTVHLDPEIYPNPKEFNPSRWDNYTPKAGTFLPFGAGSRLCPGNDLAKLEISIFLHYFLLDYRLERENPECRWIFLPHTRPKDNCLARIKKVSSTSA
ncbi:ent-kaurenoic acid oxidase 1-like isoform X2 [Populus alba x Populus x berolinensis]|nr:ent-kaurenoic acid oxidase 1-like isoform X2 [Populus alba x Populus x berolinensis]